MLDENFELQAGEWIPRSFKSLDVTLLIKTPGYFDSAVGEASRIILESTGSTGYIVPPEDRHITVGTLVSGEDTERADTQAITRRLSLSLIILNLLIQEGSTQYSRTIKDSMS